MLPDKGSSTSWITIRTDVSDATHRRAGYAHDAEPRRECEPRQDPHAEQHGGDRDRPVGAPLSPHRSRDRRNGGRAGDQRHRPLGDGSGAQNSLSLVGARPRARSRVRARPCDAGGPPLHHRSRARRRPIVDSWLSDCHYQQGDSQGDRRLERRRARILIKNNHLEGGHEALFFGGRRSVDHEPLAVRHHRHRQPHHASARRGRACGRPRRSSRPRTRAAC